MKKLLLLILIIYPLNLLVVEKTKEEKGNKKLSEKKYIKSKTKTDF